MSKLGVHVSAGNRHGFGDFLRICAEAGSPVPVVFSVDQDVWPDVQQFSPQTIVIFRHQNMDPATGGQDGPGDAYVGDPVNSARRWMAANLPAWRRNRAHYYAPINEQDAGTLPGYTWLNAFSLECLRIADENGFKLALYGFSGGNPRDGETDLDRSTLEYKWRELVPSLQFAKQHGHILLLHEYGFGSPANHGGPAASLRASAPNLALRYRRSYRFLHRFDADPPLVISEASAGAGFNTGFGAAPWLADVEWYDSELMRDRVVIGCCLYQLGGDENFKDVLPALGDYIAAAPTIAPEGDPVIDLDEETDDVAVDYVVVTHLLPQDATQAEAGQVIEIAHAARQSVVYSADDARRLVKPGLPGSKVIVWAPQRWTGGDIAAWLGVAVETRALTETIEPFWISPPITDIPLRVTDPINAPRAYANGKHEGTDFDAFDDARGRAVAVCAVQDGVIDEIVTTYPAGLNYGRRVIVRHDWGGEIYRSWYCHLGAITPGLQVGQAVERGEPIGVAGATGTTAIHLHLNVQHLNHGLSGYFIPDVIDPMAVLRVAATPAPQPVVARVGLHDLGGAEWMLRNGQRGIALDHVSITDRPIALDYTRFARAGIDIVLRVQYGYADGTGTLPPPDRLAKFEAAVIATLKQANGVLCVQYGNEINNRAEWPNGYALTPEYYVASYNRIWRALPEAVLLGPAALDPYFGPGSNNRDWWTAILAGIDDADVLFLHPKTQTNDPNEIESDARFSDEPLRWQYLHFRTIETSLDVVPGRFSNLPVILAEVNPQRTPAGLGWLPNNTEWVKRAKAWVTTWNAAPAHQAITGLVFYRFDDDDWRLRDKPALLAEIFA